MRERTTVLAAVIGVLVICFGAPLFHLVQFSRHSELYSYTLLIPFVSAYLIWLKRRDLTLEGKQATRWAMLPLASGAALLFGYWFWRRSGWKPSENDYLAVMIIAFLLFSFGAFLLLMGPRAFRAMAFPLGLLVFMVPFPTALERWIESFLQHGSAEAAYVLFRLSGMPVFRHGTEFQLPGFSMEVAPQCSGIHSSLVLFITSLLAGYLLLRERWSRAILVLLIIPLAMLRNGLRICILGHLCVRINPDWINSDLHHRGGPLFFAASLVPFFLLLLFLRKRETRGLREPIQKM
jgi:exosortase C (VPDSG-CTERM-specific)